MTKEVKAVAKKEKKTYGKKKAGLTLGEFKAWLSGVEEMQPRGWVPDAAQWKTIRSKFEDIVEGPRVSSTPAEGVGYNPANPFEREARMSRPVSGFNPPPTMIPPQQPIELSNPNRPVESTNPMADISTPEGKKIVGRVKTPNIDTSHGNYTPAFE